MPPTTGSTSTSSKDRKVARNAALSGAVDLLAVLVFVVIGRRSHANPFEFGEVAKVALPFIAALVAAWNLVAGFRPLHLAWPSGVAIWAVTSFGGVLLRFLSGQSVSWAFVVVGAAFLALFLVGWRSVVWAIARVRR